MEQNRRNRQNRFP